MGCTCSDQSRTLRVQGQELFDRAGLLGPARHMLRMDELIAQVHKDVRRAERAALLNQPLSGGVSVTEPVKLNETSGGWIYLTGLLGLDGGAGFVDPHLGGQGRG